MAEHAAGASKVRAPFYSFLSVSASAPGVAKGVKKAGTSLTSTRGLQQADEGASFRRYPSLSVSSFYISEVMAIAGPMNEELPKLHDPTTLLSNFEQNRSNAWECKPTVKARISVYGVASIESR